MEVPARGGLIRLTPKAHGIRLLESLIEQVLSPAPSSSRDNIRETNPII